ncbi:gamete and mating-type specific protein A-like isoform X2 [Liolophura sinensis]|uniref:gamete and mating-type specific protein A-like isoform X2 n=1 Tax=Liolophura sinensis TaxID=3198878 RepID=UPI003158268B
MPARGRTVVGNDGVAWPKVSYIVRCRVKPVTKKRVAREYYRRKKFAAVERYLDYMETQTRTTVRRRRQTKRSPRRYTPRRYTPRRYTPRRLTPRRFTPRRSTPRRATPRKTTPRKTTRTRDAERESSTYLAPPASTPVERTVAPSSTPPKTYTTTVYIPPKGTSAPQTKETPDRSFHMGAGKDSDDPENEYD